MKTPTVYVRQRTFSPAPAARELAFRGTRSYLGLVALSIKGLKRSASEMYVDAAAWKKLNTLSPEMIDEFRGFKAFLTSDYFLELGLKTYIIDKYGLPQTIYIMGEPENISVIERLSRLAGDKRA